MKSAARHHHWDDAVTWVKLWLKFDEDYRAEDHAAEIEWLAERLCQVADAYESAAADQFIRNAVNKVAGKSGRPSTTLHDTGEVR